MRLYGTKNPAQALELLGSAGFRNGEIYRFKWWRAAKLRKIGEGRSAVTGFVDGSAKVGTGLELRHVLFFDLNGFTGSRITANTSGVLNQRKRTKATDFNSTAGSHSLNDGLQNSIDGSFSFFGVQGSALSGNVINQFRLSKSVRHL